MAAHLAGALASHTTLPVIGVPIKSGALDGVDALYSTVQMPQGIPVATVAIDGAKNAAYLACEILSIKYPEIARKLEAMRDTMKADVERKSLEIEKRFDFRTGEDIAGAPPLATFRPEDPQEFIY